MDSRLAGGRRGRCVLEKRLRDVVAYYPYLSASPARRVPLSGSPLQTKNFKKEKYLRKRVQESRIVGGTTERVGLDGLKSVIYASNTQGGSGERKGERKRDIYNILTALAMEKRKGAEVR